MKNFLLSLSFLFIELTLFSQQTYTLADSTITYDFISLTDSIPSEKTVTEYDSIGNQILDIVYRWDSYTNDWFKSSKFEYTYDSIGNMILQLEYYGYSYANEWIRYLKHENTYNSNENMTLQLKYNWYSPTNDWVIELKYEYTYDSNGNRTLLTIYGWRSNINAWDISSKLEYTYDSNGNMILQLEYNWWSNINEWVIHSKYEYTYDSNGNRTLLEVFSWISIINDWVEYFKEESTYDSNGNRTLLTKYLWNPDLNEYDLMHKRFYFRGGYRFIENSIICSGDSILWRGDYFKTEGTYFENYISVTGRDSIYEMNLTINPQPASFSISGEISVSENQAFVYTAPENIDVNYNWITENGSILSTPSDNSVEIQWGGVGDGIIYALAADQIGCKSDTSKLEVNISATGINDALSNEVILYPNPVKDILNIKTTIEYSEIEVLDLTGKILLTSKHLKIDISFLNSGAYIVRIKDRDGVVIKTDKIMKE